MGQPHEAAHHDHVPARHHLGPGVHVPEDDHGAGVLHPLPGPEAPGHHQGALHHPSPRGDEGEGPSQGEEGLQGLLGDGPRHLHLQGKPLGEA